eukprot:GHVU01180344.1.p3 GENE.GHVU01180344.1~~GHVU01180344.1.p3  ORF type:complete len:147 (+),score=22.74 GHVU01180344.1:834-1274(+)
MIGQEYGKQQFKHPYLQTSRIRKDENDVNTFVELMEKSWVDPFSQGQSDLTSLSTGILVPPDVTSDLPRAHDVGEEAYTTFKRDHLEQDPPTVKFFDRMKKQNLKTFSPVKKRFVPDKAQGKQIVLKADRNLFGNMVIAAQSRQLN